MRAAVIMLALLLAPAVQGLSLEDSLFGVGNDGETMRYQIGDITNSTVGGFSDEFQFLKLHTKELGDAGSVLRINVQATFSFLLSSDGVWNYQLLIDGNAVPDCEFLVQTHNPGGFLAGDLAVYPSYDVECTLSGAAVSGWNESQMIDLEWQRSVFSGSPDVPDGAVVGIVIEREDFVITSTPSAFEELTGATGIEFLVFLVVITVAVVLWSRATDEIVQVFTSVLLMFFGSIAISFYSLWIGWVPFGAAIAVLGGYMLLRSVIDWFKEV